MIRLAGQEDIVQLQEIENEQAFPWSKQMLLDCFAAGYQCIVMEDDNQIIGFAIVMIVSQEAELLNIAIRKNQQRQGKGKQLLQHVIALVKQLHLKKIFLEVRASNFPAQALYQNLGFKKMGERNNYYQAAQGREDGHVYCLLV